MGDKTGIEWCDATWNPLRGCSRVSEGCRNCYAEGVAARFCGVGQPYEGLAKLDAKGNRRWTGEVRLVEHMIDQPLRWKKPRRIFVNSMSDLFHEKVPDEWIDRIWAVMALTPQHTFQILTKRPERMAAYLNDPEMREGIKSRLTIIDEPGKNRLIWPLPNVWLGTSIESADVVSRVDHLRQAPAAVRFISFEPLIGPVSNVNLQDIHWAIVGGESGPNARPIHPAWVRSLRDQCADAGVPFFFKQWGEWRPPYDGEEYDTSKGRAGNPPAFLVDLEGDVHCFHSHLNNPAAMVRVGKKRAHALLDGIEHKEFP